MQTPAHLYGNHPIAERRGQLSQLLHAFPIGPARQPDVQRLADAHHVAAFNRRRFANPHQFAKQDGHIGKSVGFAPARFGSHAADHSDFVQHDHRIFNEHIIGIPRVGLNGNHFHAKIAKALLVVEMLFHGLPDIDLFPSQERQVAAVQRGAYPMCDGVKHVS